jgi:hypothetical protein
MPIRTPGVHIAAFCARKPKEPNRSAGKHGFDFGQHRREGTENGGLAAGRSA